MIERQRKDERKSSEPNEPSRRLKMTPAMEDYVLHWGEMGSRWGVNRTVSQIHALLYLAPAPLDADQIGAALSVARSNVSTSIKELVSWDLVQVVRPLGERKEHYTAHGDPWDIVMTVMRGRKQREVDPTLAVLNACARQLQVDNETPEDVKEKILAMHEFLSELDGWYAEISALPRETLRVLMGMGKAVVKYLPRKRLRGTV